MSTNSRSDRGRCIYRPLSSYVVIDAETTGLDPERNRIIELAAVRVVRNEVVDTFSSLVNPEIEISDFISNLTGITNDMLSGAPDISDILPAFLDFVGSETVLGHNVSFDLGFLYEACAANGFCFSNNFSDTMRWSRKLYPDHRHHRLSDLVERLGVKVDGSHRALADAMATHECYQRMMRDYADIRALESDAVLFPSAPPVDDVPVVDPVRDDILIDTRASFCSEFPRFLLGSVLIWFAWLLFDIQYNPFYLPLFWSAVLFASFFVAPLIRAKNTHITVTTRRLSARCGTLRRTTVDFPLSHVIGVSVSSGFWGRMFGTGDISISTPGKTYSFRGIYRAEHVRDMLLHQISVCSARQEVIYHAP